MKKKTQILVIHGGYTFKSKKDYIRSLKTRNISLEKRIGWDDQYLNKSLGKNVQIIKPRMPLQDNAKYSDWKIFFERYIPHLNKDVILIGGSLGGIFLAKYLSENVFPKRILATYLVCPPFDNTLPRDNLVGGFKLKSDLSLLEKNSKNLYLLFSKDDNIVPISHADKYKNKLKKAKFIIFKSKNGHFQISTFPEIVKLIKNDIKNNG